MGALPVASLLALLAGPEPDTFVHYGRMESVALCRDGSTLVALDNAGFIWAWDRPTGRRFFCRRILEGRELAYRIVCSPDGAWIALAPRSPHLPARIISLKRARPNRSYDHCVSPCFSPDGKEMAAVDGTAIRRWRLEDGRELPRLEGRDLDLHRAAFSPDGKTFAATFAASDGFALWNLADRTLRCWNSLKGSRAPAVSLAFSPDSKSLAVNGPWTGLRTWDLSADVTLNREVGEIRPDEVCPIGVLRFLSTGAGIFVAWRRSRVTALDPRTDELLFESQLGSGIDGFIEISDGGDALLRVDPATIRVDRIPAVLGGEGEKHTVIHVQFLSDGTAMTLAREGEARLWDPALEKEIARFKIPPLEVRGITKDGKTVILWSEEGGVQVWDMESSQLRFKTGPLPGAQCIALSPDQSALAVGLLEGTVSIWDLGTGRERCRTRMGPAGVTAVAWSGDGRTLVWGDRLGGIVFAEGSKGQEPLVFQSRGSPVYHLSISRDGTTADVYGSGGRWRYVGELGREPEKLEVVEKDRPFRLAFESRYFERELSPDGKYAIARVGGGKVLISRVYRNR